MCMKGMSVYVQSWFVCGVGWVGDNVCVGMCWRVCCCGCCVVVLVFVCLGVKELVDLTDPFGHNAFTSDLLGCLVSQD